MSSDGGFAQPAGVQELQAISEDQLVVFPDGIARWSFREPQHWCLIILSPYIALLALGMVVGFTRASAPPWLLSWQIHVIVVGLFSTVITFEHWLARNASRSSHTVCFLLITRPISFSTGSSLVRRCSYLQVVACSLYAPR